MNDATIWRFSSHFGHTELVVVVVVIFILFGHRLPSVMASLGREMVNFRTERIYERRRWLREPTVNTFQIYVVGIAIFLLLALVATQLFSRR